MLEAVVPLERSRGDVTGVLLAVVAQRGRRERLVLVALELKGAVDGEESVELPAVPQRPGNDKVSKKPGEGEARLLKDAKLAVQGLGVGGGRASDERTGTSGR